MKDKIFTRKNLMILIGFIVSLVLLFIIVQVKTFRFDFSQYRDIEIVSFDAWYPYGEKGDQVKEGEKRKEKTKILPVSGKARDKIVELFDEYSYARVKELYYTKTEEEICILRTKVKLRDKNNQYHYYDICVSDVGKMEIINPDTKKKSFYMPKGITINELYKELWDIVELDQ